MKALAILFGALFTTTACAAAGGLLLRGLGVRLYRQEDRLFAFLSGAAILSTLIFLLTALSLARVQAFLVLGALCIGIAGWRGLWRSDSPSLPTVPIFWKRLFWGVYAGYSILYFFNAMAPEHSPDGSTYHLGLVAAYLRAHSFPRITTNMYASLSQGIEMLFLMAFSFGRHSAAALVHFSFLMALPLAIFCYARRFGMPLAGACAGLLVFCSPVVGITGTSAYNDVAAAALLFGVFYLLRIWEEDRSNGLLVVIGILCGFCYAAKYTAFVAIPFALGFVLYKSVRSREPAGARLGIVALCAAGMMAPWLVKNWVLVANPVAPFFNRFFPNPYMHIGFEEIYRTRMRQYDIPSYWRIPWEATVRGGLLQGVVGPIFLLAPLGLWALRSRAGRILLLAGLVFGLPYATNIGSRFLIPALPFIALAMAMTATKVRGAAAALVMVHAILSLPLVLSRYCDTYAWRLHKIPAAAALRIQSEDAYLLRNMPEIALARMLEELVPRDAKVFAFDGVPEAYTSRKLLVAYQAAENNTLGEVLNTPLNGGMQPLAQFRFQFPPQNLRKIRVVQTAPKSAADWTVSEFRIYHKGKELARSPEWRIRASPNPWEVGYAFDNSPVTRWRSWEGTYPGMFLEVDLGAESPLDLVVLECSAEQGEVQLRLEAQTAAGEWRVLLDKPEVAEAQPPPGMRRMAIGELKAHGIDFLLVSEGEFGWQDYPRHLKDWGLVLKARKNGVSLYGLNP